eukprot:scaffold33757_cov39-Phaeocystis_antarctica.AAC.1
MSYGAAQDGHGCGLEVKWRESLYAKDEASMCTPAESASLKTRPPVACDLASVPMTQITSSL